MVQGAIIPASGLRLPRDKRVSPAFCFYPENQKILGRFVVDFQENPGESFNEGGKYGDHGNEGKSSRLKLSTISRRTSGEMTSTWSPHW